MSGVEAQPILVPDASSVRKLKENKTDAEKPGGTFGASGPERLDKEGRRAMIGGALSAFLLVGGLLAAAFAALILIIGHLN